MESRRVRLPLALVAALLALAAAGLHAQGNRRIAYVSVVDDSGAPVADLGPADFIVREDNVAREVLAVEPAAAPMQVAVLVDNSSAASSLVSDLRTGLETFIAAMTAPTESGAHNELAIIGLADRPTILADYSTDRAALMKGVGRIFAQPDSGTTFIDAVFDTCKGLLRRGATRPVIVAVSTERADLSNRMHADAVDLLKETGARFIVLLVGPPADTSASLELRERALLVDVGTKETGGWRENLLTSMSIRPALQKLANQLTHEYRVTYSRPDTLIPPEQVTFATKRAGLTVHGQVARPEEGARR